jgi:hypothetical protein
VGGFWVFGFLDFRSAAQRVLILLQDFKVKYGYHLALQFGIQLGLKGKSPLIYQLSDKLRIKCNPGQLYYKKTIDSFRMTCTFVGNNLGWVSQ